MEREGKTEEAAAAFDDAIAQGKALLNQTPEWPAAHFTLANVYLAHGDATQADAKFAAAEFAAAIQCDRSLETQRKLVEANVALLPRGTVRSGGPQNQKCSVDNYPLHLQGRIDLVQMLVTVEGAHDPTPGVGIDLLE